MEQAAKNTDREIWRKVPGDYYSPAIAVTAQGKIQICVGGTCLILAVEDWFALASKQSPIIRHMRADTNEN